MLKVIANIFGILLISCYACEKRWCESCWANIHLAWQQGCLLHMQCQWRCARSCRATLLFLSPGLCSCTCLYVCVVHIGLLCFCSLPMTTQVLGCNCSKCRPEGKRCHHFQVINLQYSSKQFKSATQTPNNKHLNSLHRQWQLQSPQQQSAGQQPASPELLGWIATTSSNNGLVCTLQ